MTLSLHPTVLRPPNSTRPRPRWRRARPAAVLLATLLLAGCALPVKDINVAGGGRTGSAFAATAPPANPRTAAPGMAMLGSDVVFAATDGIHGTELWKSNGTPNNKTLVKDINPAPETPTLGPDRARRQPVLRRQ